MKSTFTAILLSGALLAQIGVAAEAAQTPTEQPVYFIKQPVVGSMLSRPVISGSTPFDKNYADLSPEQKNVLRQDYATLSADDEPPFPERGLKGLVKPIYTEAGIHGFEGQLVMGVEVDASGGATSVSVVKSPDSKLTEVATAALMQGKYKPAICKGQPCAMTFVLHVELLRRENTIATAGGFR